MEKNIKYYAIRLNLLKELYKDHQLNLLEKNIKYYAIRLNLLKEYNRFKNHPDYDKSLAEFPEVMILN